MFWAMCVYILWMVSPKNKVTAQTKSQVKLKHMKITLSHLNTILYVRWNIFPCDLKFYHLKKKMCCVMWTWPHMKTGKLRNVYFHMWITYMIGIFYFIFLHVDQNLFHTLRQVRLLLFAKIVVHRNKIKSRSLNTASIQKNSPVKWATCSQWYYGGWALCSVIMSCLCYEGVE